MGDIVAFPISRRSAFIRRCLEIADRKSLAHAQAYLTRVIREHGEHLDRCGFPEPFIEREQTAIAVAFEHKFTDERGNYIDAVAAEN